MRDLEYSLDCRWWSTSCEMSQCESEKDAIEKQEMRRSHVVRYLGI